MKRVRPKKASKHIPLHESLTRLVVEENDRGFITGGYWQRCGKRKLPINIRTSYEGEIEDG